MTAQTVMSSLTRIERTLVTRGYEMNATARIPPSTFSRYLEHLRWQTMADPAYPLRTYWKRGVIRAQRLELFQRVQFDEELVLVAWLGRVGRTSLEFAHRIVRRSDGVLVARASATGVNLGGDGRPLPLDEAVRAFVTDGEEPDAPALDEDAPPKAWSRELVVCPSDQDVLQHANQARYMDWVEDTRWLAARADGYGAHSPSAERPARRIHIEYRREVKAGTRIRIVTWSLGSEPSAFGFEVRRVEDSELLTRARVEVDLG
jgi:acyl-CoA thioesterase FadM